MRKRTNRKEKPERIKKKKECKNKKMKNFFKVHIYQKEIRGAWVKSQLEWINNKSGTLVKTLKNTFLYTGIMSRTVEEKKKKPNRLNNK